MNREVQTAELLEFFKALADPRRLKLIGLLAHKPHSVEELAALLDLSPSTVSHHLSYLAHVGLVSARAEGYYSIYQLETGALEAMARRLLSEETLKAQAADVDLDAYDRKVVQNYMGRDGRFKALPAQQKKLLAVLRYIAQAFEPGARYPEREVNATIARYHDDTASVRRALIEYGIMAREGGGGDYWLVDVQPE